MNYPAYWMCVPQPYEGFARSYTGSGRKFVRGAAIRAERCFKMNVTRRNFLNLAGAYSFSSALPTRLKPSGKRTNVVVIMADDHGAWATQPYGCSDIHTPHLSALAEGGARFDRSLVCTPVCSPSRLTYLTSLLPSRHGVQDWLLPEDCAGPGARDFLQDHLTYTEVLAQNGYTLGMCGKWHMGKDAEAQGGFSHWVTVPGGGGTYKDPVFVHNGVQAPVQGFREDAIGDFALEFLDAQQNTQTPFYLAVNFYAPHTPYSYQPEEYRRP